MENKTKFDLSEFIQYFLLNLAFWQFIYVILIVFADEYNEDKAFKRIFLCCVCLGFSAIISKLRKNENTPS